MTTETLLQSTERLSVQFLELLNLLLIALVRDTVSLKQVLHLNFKMGKIA
jgi:hypothetical protein